MSLKPKAGEEALLDVSVSICSEENEEFLNYQVIFKMKRKWLANVFEISGRFSNIVSCKCIIISRLFDLCKFCCYKLYNLNFQGKTLWLFPFRCNVGLFDFG